jgi:hypothetical protein
VVCFSSDVKVLGFQTSWILCVCPDAIAKIFAEGSPTTGNTLTVTAYDAGLTCLSGGYHNKTIRRGKMTLCLGGNSAHGQKAEYKNRSVSVGAGGTCQEL